ncbi:UNVERIFIED_CONTAM: hypothetical protein K2H54_018772 [Gekko kuhli]
MLRGEKTIPARWCLQFQQVTPVPFYLGYHISNKEFNSSLTDPTSAYFKELNETIGQMYWSIYGCPTCNRSEEYRGYDIIKFRPGSVAVESVLFFETKETPEELAQVAQEAFEKANTTERQELELTAIQGSSYPSTTPEPSTTSTESPTRNTTLPGPSTASTMEGNDTITTNSSTTEQPPSNVTSTASTTVSNNTITTNSNTTEQPPSSVTSTASTTMGNDTITTNSNTTEQPPSNVTSTASTTMGNDTITMNSSTTEQPPSNVTSQMTSTATLTIVPFYLSYHITNRVFTDSLWNENSADYQELNETIGKMYENIYGCPTCARRDEYRGYNILNFGPGSIAVETVLHFETREAPEQLAQTAKESFENASTTERQELELTSIQGEQIERF